MNETRRDLTELSDAESLALLGSVSLGRIVFTMRALPMVRPVSHILVDGRIVIRSDLGAAIVSQTDANSGAVVAYEADDLDPVERLGWSVSITGTARILRDADQVERYRRRLSPWVNDTADHIITIYPELISGFRLTAQRPAEL